MNRKKPLYKLLRIIRELISIYKWDVTDENSLALESRLNKAIERISLSIPYAGKNGMTDLWSATTYRGTVRNVHLFTEEQKSILYNNHELIRYMVKYSTEKKQFQTLINQLDKIEKERELPFSETTDNPYYSNAFDLFFREYMASEITKDDPILKYEFYFMIQALFEDKFVMDKMKLREDVETVERAKSENPCLEAFEAKRRLSSMKEYVRLKGQE